MLPLILTLHAGSTLYMVGLIWFVQLVQYPLFAAVGAESFEAFHAAHMRRTGFAVGPPMLAEAATAALLLGVLPAGLLRQAAWLGALALAAVWLSTALLQVPTHRALQRGFDTQRVATLVRGNWIRTALWSLRGVLALGLLWAARSGSTP